MLGLKLAAASAAVKGAASAVVPQDADAVHDFIARDFFSNYQRWSPQVVELEPRGPVPVRPGVTARQVTLDRGMRSESTFEVVQVDESRLVLEGRSEPFRSTYQFERIAGGETALSFEFEMRELDLSMRPFAKLIRMALQEGAEQIVENLKSLLEDGAGYARPARAS